MKSKDDADADVDAEVIGVQYKTQRCGIKANCQTGKADAPVRRNQQSIINNQQSLISNQ
jgi:hypothetical protein